MGQSDWILLAGGSYVLADEGGRSLVTKEADCRSLRIPGKFDFRFSTGHELRESTTTMELNWKKSVRVVEFVCLWTQMWL